MSDSNDQFNELVQVEYPGLFAASNIIVMDHSIAEEIVQDALEKTYLRWKKIQRYDRPGAWVRRIVINASLSHIRRRRVERAHLTQLEQLFETSTRESDLTHFVLWSEVANLPDQQATAVAMHYGADMAINDIGHCCGCGSCPCCLIHSALCKRRYNQRRAIESERDSRLNRTRPN